MLNDIEKLLLNQRFPTYFFSPVFFATKLSFATSHIGTWKELLTSNYVFTT